MDYISFTNAAKEKKCGRNTLYRAARDGRIDTAEVAGRKVIVENDRFEAFKPRNLGARAARHVEDESNG